MNLRQFRVLKRLNVEHRTSNIEHPLWMALRFIYLKTNEPQICFTPSIYKLTVRQKKLTAGRIPYSMFISFFFGQASHSATNDPAGI